MRLFSLFTSVLCALLAGSLRAVPPSARLQEGQRFFLDEHCVECHSADKQKGGLRLDDISFALDSVAVADQWQKILNQINSGEMPPEEAKQPKSEVKTEFLEALSSALVTARRTLGDSGGRLVVRRLNKREYRNTVRDLLGVDADVRDLPADGGSGAFDTVGSSLFMSSDQLEQYLLIGRRALDDAFARHAAGKRSFRIHTELEKVAETQLKGAVKFLTKKVAPYDEWTAAVDAAAQLQVNSLRVSEIRALDEVLKEPRRFYRHWAELVEAPSPVAFGFKDAAEGEGVKHQFEEETGNAARYFKLPHVDKGSYLFVFIVRPQESVVAPADWPPGQYTLRVRMAALEDTPATRHFIEVGHPTQPGAFDILSAHQVTGSIEQPQTIEVPVTLSSTGSRTFAIREKRWNSREQEVAIAVLYRNKHKTWYPPAMWIDWIELEGPTHSEDASTWAGFLFDAPSAGVSEREHARQVIEKFAVRAFRQKRPDAVFIESVADIFTSRRSAGDPYEKALKEALCVVLAAPGFLYLSEPVQPGTLRPLSGTELAARLSYFLWSAPPDAGLIAAASEGKLSTPAGLAQQVDRMIDSPKSHEFSSAFVQQWLGMDRLDFFRFNAQLFPDFDDSAKMAARAEVVETFHYLLKSGGSLDHLLKSDKVVLNGLLAGFYGIEGVSGDEFRAVSLPRDSPRGGLLGMAAIMAMGSNGERTSPVERGAWVLRKLLHDPPPPAPPNIPQLSRLSHKPLSPRERVVAHQEEPQCRQCHRKIDPIGFGLENFDAIGRWRTTEVYTREGAGRREWPIDPSGAFHKGPKFADFLALREVVASKRRDFARGFSEALFEYALGRPVSFFDEESVAGLAVEAGRSDFALREFVHALVRTREFQTK